MVCVESHNSGERLKHEHFHKIKNVAEPQIKGRW